MKEIWKDIKGFNNYQVSNKGRVRSKDRQIYQKNFGWRNLKGMVLKEMDNGHGYKQVMLNEGKRHVKYIHRLVADAFLDNPLCLPEVNHIDFDRSNNCVENLEWISTKDNAVYSIPNYRRPKNVCRSNTGYKYICHKKCVYEVCVIHHGDKTRKSFKRLEDAVVFRDRVAKEHGIEFKDNNNKV